LIPFPIAPLKGITVLVTRPATQAESLCERISTLGGEAIPFPTVAIEAISCTAVSRRYDWLVFVSANAVRHGLTRIVKTPETRIAAIGKATAAALAAHDILVDAMPEQDFTSEALLAHPALAKVTEQNVLIVKGAGGREILYETLVARGAEVSTLEVYRRVQPSISTESVRQLERRWRDDGIHIVTLTSVETLEHLLGILGEEGRELLKATPYLAGSDRIAEAARARGLTGECVLSRGADDDSMVGAIASWHARAR
jgi:uroporphyrinogen-III synthase